MSMAYQDMHLRTETNMLTHWIFPLAFALWPDNSMSLQDDHGYGYQLDNSDGP